MQKLYEYTCCECLLHVITGVKTYVFGDVGIDASFDKLPIIYDTESIEPCDLPFLAVVF
jgi:hypothetical protein